MLQKAEEILKNHGLRKTDFRIQVLKRILSKPEVAVSQKYIEEGLGNFDRITLYRTLKSFEKLGIIHKAVDGLSELKFALCQEGCTVHKHDDKHAHFHCETCGETFCLDGFDMPKIDLDKNYLVNDIQLALSGVCVRCNQN